MSLFPHYLGYIEQPSATLHPIFRFLDDIENLRPNRSLSRSVSSLTPKFDVKEDTNAYELHGELPGIDQSDIDITFTDAQTLSIRGRSTRTYTAGTPPAGLVGAPPEQGRIAGDVSGEHRARVADEEEERARERGQVQKQEEQQQPESRYWVSERSVGEFSRSFHFPNKVDQDAVKASMKNGILSIVVPKVQAAPGGKRITIS